MLNEGKIRRKGGGGGGEETQQEMWMKEEGIEGKKREWMKAGMEGNVR